MTSAAGHGGKAATPSAPSLSSLQRSSGSIATTIERRAAASVVTDLRQAGAYRLRLPRPTAGCDPEAVLINTAGGMTGGDRFDFAATLGPGAAACVTGQACEKIYRSAGGQAQISTRLQLAAGAEFSWLPQPAILFQGAALTRCLTLDLAPGACAVALEANILGRAAMGELVSRCRLRERWRVRVDGQLVWANDTRLDAPVAEGRWLSTLDGGCATATMVVVGPDAGAQLEPVRTVLDAASGRGGASSFDGVMVAMLVAADADALMEDLRNLIEAVRQRPIPRVWTC